MDKFKGGGHPQEERMGMRGKKRRGCSWLPILLLGSARWLQTEEGGQNKVCVMSRHPLIKKKKVSDEDGRTLL